MKKMYHSPELIHLVAVYPESNFCASANVPGVTTGSQNGLEGWFTDPIKGEWEGLL